MRCWATHSTCQFSSSNLLWKCRIYFGLIKPISVAWKFSCSLWSNIILLTTSKLNLLWVVAMDMDSHIFLRWWVGSNFFCIHTFQHIYASQEKWENMFRSNVKITYRPTDSYSGKNWSLTPLINRNTYNIKHWNIYV